VGTLLISADLCPECGTTWGWCGWCGSCVCECDCWAEHYYGTVTWDPRYNLWNDESGQKVGGRPVDTVTLAVSLL
jgi:hypothetical protein